jgi:hypothetical protein
VCRASKSISTWTTWVPYNCFFPMGLFGTSPYTLQLSRHPSLQLGGPGLRGSSPHNFKPFATHSISHCTTKSLPRIASTATKRGGTGIGEREGWDFQCLESFPCRDWVGAHSLSHALHLYKARDCSPYPPL